MSLTSNMESAGARVIAFPSPAARLHYGAVAIGRNEDQRPVGCLKSLSDADGAVDSGSTDDSEQRQPVQVS